MFQILTRGKQADNLYWIMWYKYHNQKKSRLANTNTHTIPEVFQNFPEAQSYSRSWGNDNTVVKLIAYSTKHEVPWGNC